MDTISVACQCGRVFQVRSEHAGRRAKCPACGQVVLIPNLAPPSATDRLTGIELQPQAQALKPPPIMELPPELPPGLGAQTTKPLPIGEFTSESVPFWRAITALWIRCPTRVRITVGVLTLCITGVAIVVSLAWRSSKQRYASLLMEGVFCTSQGDYDKAIAAYNEATRIAPNGPGGYLLRGLAWAAKEEHDRAIADYTEAIRLDPKDAFVYFNRGHVWSDKKEYDKAIADFTEAIRLDPERAYAYNERGLAWAQRTTTTLPLPTSPTPSASILKTPRPTATVAPPG